MRKLSAILGTALWLLLFLVPFTYAQLDQQDKPLGDVARAQKEGRKQNQKKAESSRVLTNKDVIAESKTEAKSSAAPAPTSQAQENQRLGTKDAADARSACGNQEKQAAQKATRPVLDRQEESTPDVITVPAGTELKVDVDQGHTIVPVRVGFATPVPALSHVEVQVSRTYFNTPYFYDGAPGISYVDYLEYATVTAVTVAGQRYEVHTNTLPLSHGGTNSELTFVLDTPVAVLR